MACEIEITCLSQSFVEWQAFSSSSLFLPFLEQFESEYNDYEMSV